MDQERIGKFITKLRKEKGFTQEDLGKELDIQRESISKWERGLNMPNPECLLKLSSLFDVSVNEIILGERKNTFNEKKFDNISLNVLKESNKKFHKLAKIFLVEVVLVILFILGYYFFNTYNTIHIYRINGHNQNFQMEEGILFLSKKKSYLKLGRVESDNGLGYEKLEIYYLEDGKKKIITSLQSDNYIIISNKKVKDLIPYKKRKDIVNNTYLDVKYNGQKETIKLNFIEDNF